MPLFVLRMKHYKLIRLIRGTNMLSIIPWNLVDYMDQLSLDQLINKEIITPNDKPIIDALNNVYI